MRPISESDLVTFVERAVSARAGLIDIRHESAFRLFNGFYEGCPDLAIDVYATTLLVHNYAANVELGAAAARVAAARAREMLPWLTAVLIKTRNSSVQAERNGVLLDGGLIATRIREGGTRYALDLTLNRDASLYLDTRNLRAWAQAELKGMSVLNTFAYTGSLGVAALAGGAARVVQLDLNGYFLNVAKTSYTLNGFPIRKADFIADDFFPALTRLNRTGEQYDCVFLDPPFFSVTPKGVVDLEKSFTRLINKARPLVRDGGRLIVINNALFTSGAEVMHDIEALAADGYLAVEALIPVPEDFTGYAGTRVAGPPVDPAPFNHPTKITILRVRKKAKQNDNP
ncbi:MAG TPA: class I SAM-dependent methyltransferase [Thermoflexales bacterium]|nr:class I SAM-dependent methyltransferase [Thermoflexales bacterium]HQY24125.1 class I SAM-dependent methyltransferase [Thermoflexales bacterium]HQZ52437.1 class I SAM-dependent methyltransferase [Thermoflexales bacterium]HRA53817.1 class I SAM-dependent methyltransferase [Thermoflexales bacterium]